MNALRDPGEGRRHAREEGQVGQGDGQRIAELAVREERRGHDPCHRRQRQPSREHRRPRDPHAGLGPRAGALPEVRDEGPAPARRDDLEAPFECVAERLVDALLHLPGALDRPGDGAPRDEERRGGEDREGRGEGHQAGRFDAGDDGSQEDARHDVGEQVRERLREHLGRLEDRLRRFEVDVLVRREIRAQNVPGEDARRGTFEELGFVVGQEDALKERPDREDGREDQRDDDLLADCPLDQGPGEGGRQDALEEHHRRDEGGAAGDGWRGEGAKVGEGGARAHGTSRRPLLPRGRATERTRRPRRRPMKALVTSEGSSGMPSISTQACAVEGRPAGVGPR